MTNDVAKEHYMENSKLDRGELNLESASKSVDDDDVWNDDGSLWEDSNEDLDKTSDLDREWQRRRTQFHTTGYRDGVVAGKEVSAQEGFNIGFKESVYVGLNWGIVRGVTSALACLPDVLKERLVETQEKRNKLQHLYESVNSLSTGDASKLFYDEIASKSREESGNVKPNVLQLYSEELQVLILESPAITIHSEITKDD